MASKNLYVFSNVLSPSEAKKGKTKTIKEKTNCCDIIDNNFKRPARANQICVYKIFFICFYLSKLYTKMYWLVGGQNNGNKICLVK